MLIERGQAHQARIVEQLNPLNPNYTEAQLNLMVTLNDLGEYDRARQIFPVRSGRPRDMAGWGEPCPRCPTSSTA